MQGILVDSGKLCNFGEIWGIQIYFRHGVILPSLQQPAEKSDARVASKSYGAVVSTCMRLHRTAASTSVAAALVRLRDELRLDVAHHARQSWCTSQQHDDTYARIM